MSSEDLDAWDVTLQVCLAHVLNDSGEATRVLDHHMGTIVSMHIPTGASAMCMAELLLSYLDSPPDTLALLGFVNDMLMSMYPPEPQNKVASMWLIHAAMRVMDMCPVKKLCEVVTALQEGLSDWVMDQYRVLTVEEYTFDVHGFLSSSSLTFDWVGSDVIGCLGCSIVSNSYGVLAVSQLIDRHSQNSGPAPGSRFHWPQQQTTGRGVHLP